jgi:hypothetical protein
MEGEQVPLTLICKRPLWALKRPARGELIHCYFYRSVVAGVGVNLRPSGYEPVAIDHADRGPDCLRVRWRSHTFVHRFPRKPVCSIFGQARARRLPVELRSSLRTLA